MPQEFVFGAGGEGVGQVTWTQNHEGVWLQFLDLHDNLSPTVYYKAK